MWANGGYDLCMTERRQPDDLITWEELERACPVPEVIPVEPTPEEPPPMVISPDAFVPRKRKPQA